MKPGAWVGLLCLGSVLCAHGARASDPNAGKAVAIALPVAAGGIALLHHWDWEGAEQLAVDTGLTVGTALILKEVVREQRPDGSDWHSFPSDTAALAFAPASFLWDRYGWQYGAPAYLVAGYVGYERVQSKQHHWYDVAASAAIGWTYSRLITTRYRHRRFYTDVYANSDGAYVNFRYQW
ncbi:MAG TPA: phosphatase PAP2 family protein [Rhizomicrobium sp.]|jgi:membrane-associated phospholipid phosphatase|nr:phosphatase PAP2 family protein [Rhizomicrobium sp.]